MNIEEKIKINFPLKTGKKGVVYLGDVWGNQFSPKEFKEEDLNTIFINLKFK